MPTINKISNIDNTFEGELFMQKTDISDLVPGMIVAENVVTFRDQLLYPAGYRLTDKAIIKLAFYSIPFIFVEDEHDHLDDTGMKTYSERVRNAPEFQQFAEEFEKDVYKFKNVINDVVKKNAPLDINDILQNTLALLHHSTKNVHILEMINNMRQYDDSTYAHSINVALISNVLATWLHMSENEVYLVTQCGLLHDIGKLKVPDSIIKKPGRLTDEEFNIVKTHPFSGYEILSGQNLNPHIANCAMMHHERTDGSGYPYGLRGEKIDTYAKIISIADVYDAMTSARVYRGAMCPFKVINILESEGLSKYDTHFLLTFIENILNTYIKSNVRLSDGRCGEVIMINKQALSRPLIRCGSHYIDLSKEPDVVYIEEII